MYEKNIECVDGAKNWNHVGLMYIKHLSTELNALLIN